MNTFATKIQKKELPIRCSRGKYGQEIDSVADCGMRVNASESLQMLPKGEEALQLQPMDDEELQIQMKCEECEKDEMLQPKFGSGGQYDSPFVSQQIQMSNGNGTTLPSDTNQFMSSAFGNDFSGVHIHTDSNALQMNQKLGARAFTTGNDIYFNRGEYSPQSSSGKHLLAHELTHVVQQNDGVNRKIQMMSAANALKIAHGLNTTYPNWLDVLPDCPCTYAEAMLHPDVWEDSTSPFTSSYHPGADKDVRTKNGYQTIPGSSHGQQCTYDTHGKLITTGPGAGTPDVWSPKTIANFLNHRDTDVKTYEALGSNVYVRYWTPNNGNNCEANVGGGGNAALTSSSEAKIVEIRDLLYDWTSEADVRRIIAILASVTSATEMQAIRFDISPLLVPHLSDIGDRTRIRVALVRL